MTAIVEATEQDIQMLSRLAATTFVESHGHSASATDINNYVDEKYSEDAFKKELSDTKNIYHIIYHNAQPAGYTKIIFDSPYSNRPLKNITKLERIYILKEMYGLQLGEQLLNFNINLSKENGQAGMWLYTWKENHRAVSFYKKNGFNIIGSYDFKISPTHTNPNHQMLLLY